ncbi:hypothetical protein PYR74_05300 [Acinetobacter bereziniae]|uniref:hypothetical protein n=1 Tax=Acinetobacter TaxID=469 RepID=UPI000347CB38|nr:MULTISPECIES: hypothetical protein [Acinetobacter]WEI23436.1 hypothetical protein PYR74_05300 [Acinetobacter bereziniae]CEI54107.1 hypothetical protein [Acinetobacter bereziniae]
MPSIKEKVKHLNPRMMRNDGQRFKSVNFSTIQALNNKIVLTVEEALTRYMNEVSRYKKTGKKEIQRLKYYQNNLPFVDWPLANYRSEYLKQWESVVMNQTIRPLSAASVLRDYSTLSAFFNWCMGQNDLEALHKAGVDVYYLITAERTQPNLLSDDAKKLLKLWDSVELSQRDTLMTLIRNYAESFSKK